MQAMVRHSAKPSMRFLVMYALPVMGVKLHEMCIVAVLLLPCRKWGFVMLIHGRGRLIAVLPTDSYVFAADLYDMQHVRPCCGSHFNGT